jgi:hypothetical protein
MAHEIYSRVMLASDRYISEGAKPGAIGYVIEVYPDNTSEVEFSTPDGITYAQIVANDSELKPAPMPPAGHGSPGLQ